jgi:hypothetical protein
MSNTSHTTYDWTCDLCGKDAGTTLAAFNPPDKLTRFTVVDKNRHRAGGPLAGHYEATADICQDCMQRPIADLAGIFADKALEKTS